MSRYNTKKVAVVATPVVNHQGGVGYKYDPKSELVAILATGIDNKYYEKIGDREQRLSKVIAEVASKDKTFVAKALVYARTVMGQRTVTHFGAVDLAKALSGDDLGTRFFSKRERNKNKGGIIFRLDDMLEIAACYQARNPETDKKKLAAGKTHKPLSNAIKKGFKSALESADAYELAKYQASSRDLSLVDLVNLVHPKPSKKMAPIFEQLMKGELKQFNTVEDKNTKAGIEVAAKVKAGTITKAEAVQELQEAKEENYAELIATKKIGYLALLRNLRNILKNSSNKELIKEACDLLTDEKFVKKSLVFPHQIDLALEVLLLEFSTSQASAFIKALDKAYELSVPNLSELFSGGNTAVVYDTSGSMSSGAVSNGKLDGKNVRFNKTPAEKAGLIGATLAKGIGADLYHFASSCEQIKFNPNDSINTIKNIGISLNGRVGHGTDFQSIFTKLGNKYDRVFIISDMQGRDYVERYQHNNMHIYNIDIVGYGTTMFKPGSKVYQIFGYSSDIYELVKKVELDPKALFKAIEEIEI